MMTQNITVSECHVLMKRREDDKITLTTHQLRIILSLWILVLTFHGAIGTLKQNVAPLPTKLFSAHILPP